MRSRSSPVRPTASRAPWSRARSSVSGSFCPWRSRRPSCPSSSGSGCSRGLSAGRRAARSRAGLHVEGGLADEALEASEPSGQEMIRGLANGMARTSEWLRGDLPAAEARLKEAVRIQDGIGHRWGMLMSLAGPAWVAGSCGQLERAAGLLGAGAALSHELGITLFPYAQVHHDACEATVRAGLDEARYRSAWDRGFGLAREQVAAAALEETLASGRDAPAVAAPARDADELSARELEVARLAAKGLTNPAIAADLFVSVATVKTHMSHILGKLDLQSRVQLAGWVAGHDAAPPEPNRS